MDPALVDIGAGAINHFANSKYYDKIYDRIPNPKKRLANYRQRRKSTGHADRSGAQLRQQDAQPRQQDERNGFGYDGNYDDDYDYNYRDSRRPRERARRDDHDRYDHYDRYDIDDRQEDYYREAPPSRQEERRDSAMIPYRPRPARAPDSRRALSVSGLQGGRAPFTQVDDSEDEDDFSRSRRDFTRAYVETDAFNDQDGDSPATPSDAYSGRRSSSIRSRASRRSHAQDKYEVVRFSDERDLYEYPPPSASHEAPSGGGMKPASEYQPPPYPYPRTTRAVSVRGSRPPSPTRRARTEAYRTSYSGRDAYPVAPSQDHEHHRHGSIRSSASRRRRRSKSPYGNGVASAAMGALAGGFLGTELTKGDTLATVAAAVVGAVGAHEAERKYEKFEQKRQGRNERSPRDEDDYYYERRRRSR